LRISGTKEKILKEGRALLQRHGYNGFSFQDIADRLDIKKPSLYDHYASKEDLILAILQDYNDTFDRWIMTVKEDTPLQRVQKVFDVFYVFSCDKGKVCPVLSLAADFQGLTKVVQKEMKAFVDKWLHWLELQIAEGQKKGQIRKDMDAKNLAIFIYNQAMGSQFQARVQANPKMTVSAGHNIITFIRAK
jgi:TetR/AcrR family transcriptional repressor of nem operon